MKYKACAINCEPILYEKGRNIAHQLKLVKEAAENGAKLIALPEMATTGYCFYDRKDVKDMVEPVPGDTVSLFEKTAKEYDCYIVFGMPEVEPETNLYYNTAVLVGPQGYIGKHRKTHGYISEPKWSKQGDLDHQVFDTPIGRIGMLICMDIHFIETARLEALAGADVIVHISNWLAEKTPAPYWITRAFDNGCYVLESNRVGLERTVQFSGGSCLIDPDGSIISYAKEKDEIVYGEIDLEKARDKSFRKDTHKLNDRRPECYKEIASNSYLWNPLDFFGLYGYDPLPGGKQSKVAVSQMKQTDQDTRGRLDEIKESMKEASAQGAELIVFPERALNGGENCEEIKENALEKNSPVYDELIDAAMKYRIYAVVGLATKEGESYHNSAALIGPEGILGIYDQVHLSGKDKLWAKAGEGFEHYNTPIGRIGIMIGTDSVFPESGRILALRGCDLIACPCAATGPKPYGLEATVQWQNYPIPMGYSRIHWHLWRTRAGENNCYLIFSNYAKGDAKDYFGRSGIFMPDTFAFPRNEVILSEDQAELGYLMIDTSNCSDSVYPTNVVRRKDLVCMRQPLWYDPIV
ncbi:MAG: amidohydrolase [Lachnospiraceae bacterium]|nr:amidohydrolase [Lachnospiraceae bacterium]